MPAACKGSGNNQRIVVLEITTRKKLTSIWKLALEPGAKAWERWTEPLNA
jgi:hypothetical protein